MEVVVAGAIWELMEGGRRAERVLQVAWQPLPLFPLVYIAARELVNKAGTEEIAAPIQAPAHQPLSQRQSSAL